MLTATWALASGAPASINNPQTAQSARPLSFFISYLFSLPPAQLAGRLRFWREILPRQQWDGLTR